jgi:3-dehydroquinate synthetase
MQAIGGDKKKRAGKLNFIVPAASGAELISSASLKTGILEQIINGEALN